MIKKANESSGFHSGRHSSEHVACGDLHASIIDQPQSRRVTKQQLLWKGRTINVIFEVSTERKTSMTASCFVGTLSTLTSAFAPRGDSHDAKRCGRNTLTMQKYSAGSLRRTQTSAMSGGTQTDTNETEGSRGSADGAGRSTQMSASAAEATSGFQGGASGGGGSDGSAEAGDVAGSGAGEAGSFEGEGDMFEAEVPGKMVLSEEELIQQRQALEGYAEMLRKDRLRTEAEASRLFGFVRFAETLNGRLAMFFFVTGLLTEYWTDYSIPEQVELLLRTLGVI